MVRSAAFAAFVVMGISSVVACGATVDIGGFDPADGGTDGSGSVDGSPRPDGATPSGPTVEVRLRATQAEVPVAQDTSGQQPIAQSLSIVSLLLYQDASDTAPLVVFDQKQTTADGVECNVGEATETSIATVPISSLRAGKYTRARIGVAYVKWKVNGVAHAGALSAPGTFTTVQVLTKGAKAEGAARDQGYYKTSFETTGQPPYVTEGTQPLPIPPKSGIIGFVDEGDAAFYEFPVDLTVDLGVTQNLASVFEVNTYENFRWVDQDLTNYTAGVWDTTGAAFEPVVSFGVNSASLSFVQK